MDAHHMIRRHVPSTDRDRTQRGANLVELALIVPLLLLLLVGVADLGRAYFTYITMFNAAREGARYGVNYPHDHAGITGHVLSEATASGVDLSGAQIDIEELGSGHPVTVTVTLQFDVIMGGVLGAPAFPIRAHATFAAR